MSKFKEFTACGECDSQEPLSAKGCADESLTYCPDCESLEGKTKTLFLNTETDEILTEDDCTCDVDYSCPLEVGKRPGW